MQRRLHLFVCLFGYNPLFEHISVPSELELELKLKLKFEGFENYGFDLQAQAVQVGFDIFAGTIF